MADPTEFDFVQLNFNVDATSLADDAIDTLRLAWPDWEPADGDLDVILIETVAPMAAEAASVAGNMPSAALRTLGTDLFDVAYAAGAYAAVVVTLTVQDTSGYTIPAGSEFEVDSYAFQTATDAVVAPGATTVTGVTALSTDLGSAQNGLTGVSTASLNLPPWVTGITVTTPSAGGADPEDDVAYQNRLARELRLRAKTLVTTIDFEIEALNFTGVGRAHAVGDTARNVTVYAVDESGNPLTTALKNAILADYAQYAQVNTVYTMADPTYTTVKVTWVVTAEPNTDPAGLAAVINTMLGQILSPTGWGQPSPVSALTLWVSDNVIRVNELIALIGNVQGVRYVESVSINGGDVAELSSGLSTSGAITSLPVTALRNAIPSGTTLTLTSGTHTQAWTTTSNAAIGATAIAVASQTPTFAFPTGSTLGGTVTGDLTLPGAVALPVSGTHSGTVHSS